jgi:hypothetical protein
MLRIMVQAIAFTPHRAPRHLPHLEILRSLVVAGCAMALIFAKAPLPF